MYSLKAILAKGWIPAFKHWPEFGGGVDTLWGRGQESSPEGLYFRNYTPLSCSPVCRGNALVVPSVWYSAACSFLHTQPPPPWAFWCDLRFGCAKSALRFMQDLTLPLAFSQGQSSTCTETVLALLLCSILFHFLKKQLQYWVCQLTVCCEGPERFNNCQAFVIARDCVGESDTLPGGHLSLIKRKFESDLVISLYKQVSLT